MAAAGLFAIYRLPETNSNFYKLMVLLQVLAIVLVFFTGSIAAIGIGILTFTAFAVILNALSNSETTLQKKAIVGLVALPVLVAHVFAMNHWPFVTEIGLASIIGLVAWGFAAARKRDFETELGVLTVFAADAAIRFVESSIGLVNG
jgi:hypothetical protein